MICGRRKAVAASDAAAKASGDLAKGDAEHDRVNGITMLCNGYRAASCDEGRIGCERIGVDQGADGRGPTDGREAGFDRAVKLDTGKYGLNVQQAQNEVAALNEKVRDGKITAPADGRCIRWPVRQGDFVKVGDLLAEMATCTRCACVRLWTSRNWEVWSRTSRCTLRGTRCRIAAGKGRRRLFQNKWCHAAREAWANCFAQ